MGLLTQQDPIGIAGGINLYGYANGDPINFSDPFGLCAKQPASSRYGGAATSFGNAGDEQMIEDPECRRVINNLWRVYNDAGSEAADARRELFWAIGEYERTDEDVRFEPLGRALGLHPDHGPGRNTYTSIARGMNVVDNALTAYHEMRHHALGERDDGSRRDPDVATAALLRALPAWMQGRAFRHQYLLGR